MRLNVAGRDGALAWWNLARDHSEPPSPSPSEYTYWPSFADNGKALAVVTNDDRVIIEDPGSSKSFSVLSHLSANLSTLALSPDGRRLAAGNGDGTIQLWQVKSGRLRFRLQGPASRVTCVMFAPDGMLLASGGSDGVLTLWDTASGRIRTSIRNDSIPSLGGEFSPSVSNIAFSPLGKVLACVRYDDRDVILWDVATGRLRAILRGAGHFIKSVAFSPDGDLIASGETDGTVILWNASTLQERARLQGHSNQVSSLTFSPDGRSLASGDTDSVVRVWNLDGSAAIQNDAG
jgi:WD40 repeat protein